MREKEDVKSGRSKVKHLLLKHISLDVGKRLK